MSLPVHLFHSFLVSDIARWFDLNRGRRAITEFGQFDAVTDIAACIAWSGVIWGLLDQPTGVTDPAWRVCPLRMPGGWLITLLLVRQTLDEREAFVLVDARIRDDRGAEG